MSLMMKRALILLLLTTAACAKSGAGDDPTPTALVTIAAVQRADLGETTTAYGAAEFSP